ncbi:serine protein kinase RIO [Mobilicoccus caccae]|uniref:non-specific serine/threonine protein kinase n=1 Tax=Mobilicoccus caccae TaxID=1859295 RepID=A0ABQ6IWI0_9MICO|nr:RIO1 family regulatory kinase/ATPase [Mobilicoccus caccae]GMA41966.1 RIO kinase 1 [Mobilicoccus caccae]
MSTDQHDHASDPTPLDPRFTFDFHSYGDLDDDQRWSTWASVEPLQRGPEPRPDWVVTSQGAIDTELGILKTGKEADVFLLERGDPLEPDGACIMAAKRYRSPEHRAFHRSAAYTEGRGTRRSRDVRAVDAKSTYGRQVAAGAWAAAEWEMLNRFWLQGIPVPYPVQIDGMEILMEFIGEGRQAAPRLAQTRPDRDLLEDYYAQIADAMAGLARAGIAHGDLSAYNLLADGDRIVLIDLPQAVDIIGNQAGSDFLLRDCTNVCSWFRSRGLDVDEQELFATLIAQAW